MDKPPLGVMPRYLWDEKRMVDLTEAIERYLEAGETPPREWMLELAEVTMSVIRAGAKRRGISIEEYVKEVAEINERLAEN